MAKAVVKRRVLSFELKITSEEQWRVSEGNLFHVRDTECLKSRIDKIVRVLYVQSNSREDERESQFS